MKYTLKKPDGIEVILTNDDIVAGYNNNKIDVSWPVKPDGSTSWMRVGILIGVESGTPVTGDSSVVEQKEYKGYNGTLVLTDTAIIIKRGVKGFLLGGGMLRGDKTIPYSSIAAVQFKKAGLVAGYIQFTLVGGPEAKCGLFESTTDENSIHFHSKTEEFEKAKQLIEQRMLASRSGIIQQKSDADELAKFSELKVKGVITEEEFQKKKRQILSL